jgi:hypothetical protein
MYHNPLLSDINCIEDVDLTRDELIDLRAKTYYNWSLNQKNLGEFWYSLRESYPRLLR